MRGRGRRTFRRAGLEVHAHPGLLGPGPFGCCAGCPNVVSYQLRRLPPASCGRPLRDNSSGRKPL
eukprot:1205312-Alexandrium_andersonii.AAC.1